MNIATLVCRQCQAKWACKPTALDKPLDIYTRWIDQLNEHDSSDLSDSSDSSDSDNDVQGAAAAGLSKEYEKSLFDASSDSDSDSDSDSAGKPPIAKTSNQTPKIPNQFNGPSPSHATNQVT